MSIKIIKPGLYSTLVDTGRIGYRSSGIGPVGAMDTFAMTIANSLVGNKDDSAVIEMHFPASEILIEDSMIISITGKGFDAFLNGEKIALWRAIAVKNRTVITFKKSGNGARAYFAVAGGWKASKWLNSYSTHIGIQSSGYHGRILQADDLIETCSELGTGNPKHFPWGISLNILNEVYHTNDIRCVAGPESSFLTTDSLNKFSTYDFKVDYKSNRMGYRLNGPLLKLSQLISLVSSPVDFGTIQLLPDGTLIVLMADHQTMGGYPRIAFVCNVDLPKLAQCNAGDSIKFRIISFAEAESELLLRSKMINDLKKSCLRHYQ